MQVFMDIVFLGGEEVEKKLLLFLLFDKIEGVLPPCSSYSTKAQACPRFMQLSLL